jgi:diguanylate cyclase (GGDEF)-like protein
VVNALNYELLYNFQNKALDYINSLYSYEEKIANIYALLESFVIDCDISLDGTIISHNESNDKFNFALISYAQKLIDTVEKENQKEKDLNFLAYNDTLTGFKNKNSLQKMLKTDIRTYTLILLNVDNFSYVNTAYGCDSGDVILIEIANMLKKLCHHDLLYRINADEFGIVYKKKIDVVLLIKKIQHYFATHAIVVDNLTFHVTFSFGATVGKYTLFKKATVALKEAKERGNNRHKVYYEDENVIEECQLTQFVELNNLLHDAINNSLFVPFFQGIYDNKEHKIKHFEALVRIKHKNGFYPPYVFLETAKLSGLLPKITKIMIDMTFEIMSRYDYSFSINITEEDLDQYFLLDYLNERAERFDIDPNRVTLEILENISSDSGKNHLVQLGLLKKAGYKIAIDDFGTQYSNFERLLDTDIDFLKLDAKYIKNIDTDKKSQDIVESIIFFAKRNNIPCIAEFVHNKSVANKVQKLGIEYSQGYYYSEPNEDIIE